MFLYARPIGIRQIAEPFAVLDEPLRVTAARLAQVSPELQNQIRSINQLIGCRIGLASQLRPRVVLLSEE